MIPTKFHELTNQEVIDKLCGFVAKREDGKTIVLAEPSDAYDILQEAKNRIEVFCSYQDGIKAYLIAEAEECGDAAMSRVRFHTINEIYEHLFREKMPNSNPYIEGGAK